MNPLWDYFWPAFAAALVIGAVTGRLAFRQARIGRRNRLAAGAAATLAAALVWHGLLGAGNQLAAAVEAAARAELRHQELPAVEAKLERSPLRRRLVLSGPADDFQQAELVRMMDEIPGVSGVRWATPPSPSDGVK